MSVFVGLSIIVIAVVVLRFVWREQMKEVTGKLDNVAARLAILEREAHLARASANAERRTAAAARAAMPAGQPPPPTEVATSTPAVPIASLPEPEAPIGGAGPPVLLPLPFAAIPIPQAATERESAEPEAFSAAVAGPPRAAWRPGARLVAALKSASPESEWEFLIGGRWLNKVGVAVLVIGMALLLNYSLHYMGPSGKVLLGLGVGAVLTLGGAWLEWRRGYAIIARSLIGGGWALLYFTAYAAYNVEAARIVDDPVAGLAVLFVVAGGMIAHSLRYDSQAATGLAYFLGFLSIDISGLTPYSLAAVAILAASLVAILRRKEWPALGLFGVVATYLTHFIWSAWTPPPEGGTLAQAFWLSQGMLVLYWLLFASFDVGGEKRGQSIRLAVNLANAAGFGVLSLIATQAVYPDHLHVLAAAGAAAYAAKSAVIRWTGWRLLHRIDGSIALASLAATTALAVRPWSISAEWLGLALFVEGALVLALGLWLRELTFRVGAYLLLAGGLACAAAFNVLASPTLLDLLENSGASLDDLPTRQWPLAWITVVPIVAGLLLLERFQAARRWAPVREGERTLALAAGYAAAGLAAALLRQKISSMHVGLSWLAAGLALVEFGLWKRHIHNRIQGYALLALSGVALLVINLVGLDEGANQGAPSRWIVIAPAIAAGHYLFWRLQQASFVAEFPFRRWPAHVAAGFLVLLFWKEIPAAYLGLAWLGAGFALLEAGLLLKQPHYRVHGYGLCGLAAGALLLVNLYGVPGPEILAAPSPWIAVLPAIAVGYYIFCRLRRAAASADIAEVESRIGTGAAHLATALLATLLWKQLDPAAVAVAWAVLALAACEIGSRLALSPIALQGHVLAAAAFGRLFMVNYTAEGEAFGLSIRLLTVLPVIAFLYYRGFLAKAAELRDAASRLAARLVPLYFYGAAFGVAVLAQFELDRAHVVIAWAILAIAYLSLGVLLKERDFRLQSHLFAIAAFARSWTTNFYLTGSYHGLPERVATTAPVIACLFAAGLLWPSARGGLASDRGVPRLLAILDARARSLMIVSASVLLASLLFYSVAGNLLTIAWAVEGLLLLILGFVLSERMLRLCGLGLLSICLFKVLIIDLSDVETIYRIVSFIVLGGILLAVSFVYTRYRDVLKRYL